MTNELAIMESVLMTGDLAKLSAGQRVEYYGRVCQSVGLNPLTRPFDYITLNGKMTLYAKKDATDQLRTLKGISIVGMPEINYMDDLVVVTVMAQDASGRVDSDLGAVTITNLKGDARANAIMKAITKAKRRVTLSLAGLGWLDETETDSIPSARPVLVDQSTGEIIEQRALPAPQPEPEPGITPATLKQLNVVGSKFYGKTWDDERHKLVAWKTNGATESSKDLTEEQAQSLIRGIEKKQSAKEAAAAQQDTGEVNLVDDRLPV